VLAMMEDYRQTEWHGPRGVAHLGHGAVGGHRRAGTASARSPRAARDRHRPSARALPHMAVPRAASSACPCCSSA
jgi:hypothetical protein